MTQRYKWFSIGDINAFLGLMFDNMTVLSFLAGILIIGFGFPAEIVYKRMFPGTAFGVLLGDIIYTWMAVRLAEKTGNPRVTAIPLGLDTPSTIGIALTVLGPAFLSLKGRMAVPEAALMAWYIGMATMVMIGVIKVLLSFCGGWVQRIVPQAGLLGSLAGIGLALLAFLPLTDIFGMPLIGLISLGLILTTFVARIRLPGNLSGVLVAVVAGTALYYLLGPLGLMSGYQPLPPLELHFGLPIPTLLFVKGFREALQYLPIAVPFALLTVVGGINVTESARVAGDPYKTRDILLTEALATLAAGICGGVAQSTPYIGQSAYKRMGARSGYTLITGIFVGLCGILGFAGAIVELIPRAVLAPVFVFVALEIIVQATFSCPRRHAPAVVFSYLPTVARLLSIKYSSFIPAAVLAGLLAGSGREIPEVLVTLALGNGFILTGMLWGAFLAELIDRRLRRSAFYLGILSVFTFFGVIHSVLPGGDLYLPWRLATAVERAVPYQFAAAYLALAALFLALSFTRGAGEPIPDEEDRPE
ncbi:MAG: SulP family inorganic anion transporter [Syntrophales bacterium]